MRPRRFWWYSYRTWQPRIRKYVLPQIGGDEYGRRTLVFPAHPFGWIVWAYRTCHCEECAETREQTARWALEED